MVDGGPHQNIAIGKSIKVRNILSRWNRKQGRKGGSNKLIWGEAIDSSLCDFLQTVKLENVKAQQGTVLCDF